ncbi:MAG: hypothetical protein GIKADHBN_02099 [Phycisphaerales bacterium]|nr:hypothetical protein [Phycisphaerales bacterium]
MNGRMTHGRLVPRPVAALLVALCAAATATAQQNVRDPVPGGEQPPPPRPHIFAPNAEREVAVPQFIVPDGGICPDRISTDRNRNKPIRINHRATDIPVYDIPPDARLAPAVDDTANDWTRSQPLFQDFASMGPNGLTPPDPDLATNGTYIVAVTNDDFAVYDMCGNLEYTVDIEDYLGYAADFLLYDPKVIYDPWSNRWVMLWHKKRASTEESSLVFIITSGSTPFGLTGAGAYWYDVNAIQDNGTADESWADYYDLGYSSTAITCAGNQFRWNDSFRWARVRFLDKSEIYNANPATIYSYSNLTNADGSTTTTPRAVKMQTSWSESGANIDGLFVNARGGGGSRLTLWKLTNAFTGSSLTKADINVGAYTSPPNAVQPDGVTLDTIDCRLMIAVATSDSLGANGIELFTGLTTGFNSGADCRLHLFKINPVAAALEWEIQFGSTNQDYWFPSVVADYSGSAMWVFSRTSFTAAVEPEARYVDYDKGSFSSASSLLRTGDGNYGGFRWGDYFGGQIDWADYSENFTIPGRPAKFWMMGEYGESGSSWGTHIGASSVFTQGDLASVTPATDWNISGVRGSFAGTTSRAYTLAHTGETGVQYTVTSLPTWLSANPTDGRLDQDGATVTLTLNNAVANGLAAGNYTDTVVFSDCFNGGNSFSRTVNLSVLAPDLDILSVDAANGTYHPAENLPVQIQVQNIGTSSTGSYTIDFYASSNTIISTGDNYIGSRSYSSLGAGSSRTSNHVLDGPCVPTEGLYYIGAIANVTNDSNTGNNSGFDATRVNIEYCPADVDNSCFVDTDDYTYFVALFELGVDEADFDGSGFVDTDDFTAFVLAFEAGC